jgi:hypothetical protein
MGIGLSATALERFRLNVTPLAQSSRDRLLFAAMGKIRTARKKPRKATSSSPCAVL